MKTQTLSEVLRQWNAQHVDYAEMAYRRGFAHAASSALIAMRANASAEDFESWLDSVMDWRESRSESFAPPSININRADGDSCSLIADKRRAQARERQRKRRQRLKETNAVIRESQLPQ